MNVVPQNEDNLKKEEEKLMLSWKLFTSIRTRQLKTTMTTKTTKKIKILRRPVHSTLHEKCPNTEFFWSEFSRVGTEHRDFKYGKIWSKKKLYLDTFHTVQVSDSKKQIQKLCLSKRHCNIHVIDLDIGLK